ncbi:MAG: hypothetical protein KYX66_11330 [Blastomonas fulva]|uniref:hypothetical protein n=1 Tax=Blastomonas fulva TaxID=1550728 RepID=UPI0024E26364|nr:hypothetical protein [Blastomonas fulva]MDK2757320.1 hypothetical protein [Blastomonas fulva]
MTQTADRPHVIKDAKGKRPQFYAEPGIDQLMSMVMVLAGEVCMLRDRMDAQERVARMHGINLAEGIDALTLDEEALQTREAYRQDFLDRLFYLARKEANEATAQETDEAYRATIADIAVN